MARAKKSSGDKWKKKKWFEIYAPALMDKKKLAETVAEKPENLMGRVISLSARDVLNDAKKQHVYLNFKIDNVQGQKAYTSLLGHEVRPSYLMRIVRRRSSKIESVQKVLTKDGQYARIKSITVTQRKLAKKKETAIRKRMLEEIEKLSKQKNYDELVSELVFGNATASIYNAVKGIALIKRIEVVKSTPLAK